MAEFTEESLLAELVGRELSSVEFVRDYVQVRFDGPTLTAVTLRDQLVELVGKVVSAARFKRHDELVLVFTTGEMLRIPLDRPSRGNRAEAVVFDFNDKVRRTFLA